MPRGIPNKKPQQEEVDFESTLGDDEPRHVEVEAVRFGLPPEEKPEPAEVVEAEEPEPLLTASEEPLLPDGFHGMDTAPKDTSPVWLCFGGIANVPLMVEAYWRKTREWGGSATRWVDKAFWAQVHTSQPIVSQPIGWKR